MPSAVLSPGTRRDLLEAVFWIARENRAAALGLRDSIKGAALRIGRHPHLGIERSALAGLPIRFLVLTGYPYVLVYDADRQPALILRILHGARDLPEIFAR
ncbi:type II toxin-antitoxin system RelE/ParE family toxin [Oceanibaculum pacificum]|uniref:Plasmid stabilization protein n=1 Tax=Oceanibaculum pacificum TaxID=580166 RepID=A0A154WGG8_9PROT|nr:type II toxin-antitoxin system RelE/ParE family toxin [Oceanibaculum pacificum]KZD12607.1 hypothetical protein AUP43_04485 [Oceanibaculum pacificum]